MSSYNKTQKTIKNTNKDEKTEDKLIKSPMGVESGNITDPQVKVTKPYATKRSFNSTYKAKILAAFDACTSSYARGELLRKEGLYRSRIYAWKKEQLTKKIEGIKQNKQTRMDHLSRENEQLKKKLAQAEAIIDLQKKVSELLGKHILPIENSENA